MKTLLEIVAAAQRTLGQPIPSAVVGNPDPTVQQLLGLMQDLMTDLEVRAYWQNTVREATFTSFNQADQGFITDIADQGFIQIIPGTFWNRTTNLLVQTGLRPEEWQAIQAGPGTAGPMYQARLRQDRLLLSPTPPGGQTMAFEYHSNYFIEATPYIPPDPENEIEEVQATYTGEWTDDAHKLVGPNGLGPAWLRMAFKREKGLDYAEDQLTYETLLGSIKTRDNTPRNIHMDGCRPLVPGGVIVPVGNWTVT